MFQGRQDGRFVERGRPLGLGQAVQVRGLHNVQPLVFEVVYEAAFAHCGTANRADSHVLVH